MANALDRLVRGRIAYWGEGQTLLGQERFELAQHTGGSTLRALCEMNDIGLLRDVSIALDSKGWPLDGFCRLTRHGQVVASSWYAFNMQQIAVESTITGMGRLSQRFDNSEPYRYLGLHPLQGDALVTCHVDNSRPGEYRVVRGLTNSISENGDEDLRATPVNIEVAWLGHELLEVAAGAFAARKLALRWHPDWPPAYIWVREDDCLFLKMTWEQVNTWYELVELSE
ncbi:hypothetical protein FV139_14990 [Parahaliea maris]|uniref:Uncharacterized protein n=1 Tax=Parahaliea maris TaxID=2716870 RepID=A0A5C8ZVZ6_9GAMM|nr:hypothetical protein [Parahaliea maris]TXS92029.1 hypothetical protein FV139_14990 [Parahaliea maris]